MSTELTSLHLLVAILSLAFGSLTTLVFLNFYLTRKLAGKTLADSERQHEFLRGTVAGRAEELARFEIRYQAVLIDCDGFWNRTFDAGYEMQLFYSGLPIGDPIRRITHQQEKAKEENIRKVLETVTNTIQDIVSVAGKHRIPATIAAQARKLVRGQ